MPSGRDKHELALPAAAADPNFAVPVQYETAGEGRKIGKIPASALLAQLVEHFHGKEGVVGSSPTEGSLAICSCFAYSNGVRHVKISDPDGNAIALAEPPDIA